MPSLEELQAALDEARSQYNSNFRHDGKDSRGALDLMAKIASLTRQIAALKKGGRHRKSKKAVRRRRGKTSRR